MTEKTIKISNIDAENRKRPIDPDTVAAYAAIAEQRIAEGWSPLIQAITVRPIDGGYKLVTGGHRLAMLKEIGFETLSVGVEVNVKEMDDQAAFEDELFENLANAGLTQLDRSLFIYDAWKAYRAKKGETRGRKSKIEQLQEDKKEPEFGLFSSERFTDAAAERVGLSKTQVKLAKQIAERLIEADAVDEIRGTMVADNQNELKQLVDMPAGKRREAAAAIKRGEAKNIAQARVVIGLDKQKTDDPQARYCATVLDAWGRSSKLTRITIVQTLGSELKKLVLEHVKD
ncbi:ParB/RepB/Spo0J family partition protein [Methylocystis sp. WRRC1]|uniref:ParB/RepB/Spo0J family partition protein n=1 Tax=unclassified Methylocystis TaxID=2625913 RepID=UPI0001F8683E|nr:MULTISPECIES: ParB/RepB/Spo0J family partition protein [unclassified Methylocystis]MCC3246184.1 ParB/RepB/Spo0J family partition protein [Methylocystis sp. WRRC1]